MLGGLMLGGGRRHIEPSYRAAAPRGRDCTARPPWPAPACVLTNGETSDFWRRLGEALQGGTAVGPERPWCCSADQSAAVRE